MACERDYNKLVDDVQSEAFKFRKEYRCRHKVFKIFVVPLLYHFVPGL